MVRIMASRVKTQSGHGSIYLDVTLLVVAPLGMFPRYKSVDLLLFLVFEGADQPFCNTGSPVRAKDCVAGVFRREGFSSADIRAAGR